ncbi:MAG: protein jag [Polyangiales bacterium]
MDGALFFQDAPQPKLRKSAQTVAADEQEGAVLRAVFDDDFDDDEGQDDVDFDDDLDDIVAEKADYALEVLQEIIDRMDFQCDVRIREADESIVLDVRGSDAGRVIGKKGQTLDALQFLINKVVNRFPKDRCHITVDSGDYRERYDNGLVSMAKREAKRAVQQGKVISLQPMSARDRRLVHLSLAKLEGVHTESQGEGMRRRVQIIPARATRSQSMQRRR